MPIHEMQYPEEMNELNIYKTLKKSSRKGKPDDRSSYGVDLL